MIRSAVHVVRMIALLLGISVLATACTSDADSPTPQALVSRHS